MGPLRSAAARPKTDPDEFRDLHLRKLRAGLAEVLKSNAFWRSRLGEVRSWGDFERLPLTTKAELLADQASQPPYGTNLTFPLDRYVRLHQRSEEHTSELQSRSELVCRLLLEKKKKKK